VPHKQVLTSVCFFLLLSAAAGCSHFGHYPVNAPLEKFTPGYGYIAQNMGPEGNSEELLLVLSFSGGGTRAAAFSYGVLEELRATEVAFDGKKRRLLDEVDMISGVSGGSFTAAYLGLFGERIFEDYESRFLKKNIQGEFTSSIFLNPVNWFRLSSPLFDRSDLAAEYYDKGHLSSVPFQRHMFGSFEIPRGQGLRRLFGSPWRAHAAHAEKLWGQLRLCPAPDVRDILPELSDA
jgi:NTE family protein